MAGLPFFKVTRTGFLASTFFLHLTQYACIVFYLPFNTLELYANYTWAVKPPSTFSFARNWNLATEKPSQVAIAPFQS